MAEGVLGGILGEDAEPSELEGGAEALAAPQAFAAAVAADQAKQDPAVAAATADFLRHQSNLLQIQSRHLEDEHALRLAHLQGQHREGRLRRTGQRIRIGMQVFTGLVITVLGLGVLVMVYDAFSSKAVVVDAFAAPPALAARGVSGEVVAAGVLDALQKLQAATRVRTRKLNAHSAWASDVKIEVPDTGVSIGEVGRMLHARFGHDVHIGGDLVQTGAGGLALTVRGDGVSARTFTGGAEDLDKLTAQAAEYAYGQSQPLEFVTYLNDSGRAQDGEAFAAQVLPRLSTDAERAEMANSWGNALSTRYKTAEAAAKYRLAVSLMPNNWKSWGNLVGALSVAEGEEAAWREAQAMNRAIDASPRRLRPPVSYLANVGIPNQDWMLQLAASLDDAKQNQGAGAQVVIEGPQIADDYAHLHDFRQAQRYLQLSDPNDLTTRAGSGLFDGQMAMERGDAAAAVAPLEAFWKAWLSDTDLQYTYNTEPCLLGLAYGLTGRMADAEAVFKRVGPWAYCYGAHGDVLVHAGDLAGAQRVWAEGLRIGPDLSPVYLERGSFELARGDLKHAEADLAAASARSPHWADPLKAWGDVLMREGRPRDALAKYDEALKYAPAWPELHQARAAAAKRG